LQRLQEKIVVPERASGTILDIGYHGVLAEVRSELPLFSELKLEVELPLVAHQASDIYARVVKVLEKGGRRLCGLEFTSLSVESNAKLQLFVQMLLQGHEADEAPSWVGRADSKRHAAQSSGSTLTIRWSWLLPTQNVVGVVDLSTNTVRILVSDGIRYCTALPVLGSSRTTPVGVHRRHPDFAVLSLSARYG